MSSTALRVAVGDVHDDDVDAGVDQRLRPPLGVLADADGRADDQPAVGVLGGAGNCSLLVKSLTVISPRSRPPSSTSGSFSILLLAQQRQRLVAGTPTGAVTSGIGVMTSRTRRDWSVSKRMSRLVTMPTQHAVVVGHRDAGDPVVRAQPLDVGERSRPGRR